ncbi:hypothetical protein LEP1GSC103_3326 [Leptospira borgpetersenii serovar Javanica str. UI 09931]|uniref:Uncharacterized protein n=4 Tax=Leptospira borgpetersenii TaxID=174 RepID=M3HM11_LEPBO|nr:hypothetical protein LEP1GSC128_2748 [Leptospira borgpetersenii str. 200801926]EKQ90608.1 hypothetical protein LEP1GSC101_0344 [Leptospira borgpetersenii str. UI 09149]EKR01517.1 hypothetical protein LEP1GSC121_4192 [Leptospira borgpetersenii serovar Castellonis str. 200801910]EMF98699.1 hypothetical protein LEP1GSC123_2937 [Leptospira borgpetersenii str. 200701203]EMK12548.1 hypothetical protein LEP1GSC066_2999 [Leptospira sp. serovar Kenya str. Sh9]EMN14836.1 hypothetical protein LEP1GSC0
MLKYGCYANFMAEHSGKNLFYKTHIHCEERINPFYKN